ncbi:hypothetical protein [Cupriavidus sp. MP-37]|uniref:hypothetical protein n=1 Tax=Cupriavidus sp. MP-37 TaxID=2884455 RepID=UPI001D0B4570|nr:hypothetical protein [Cupriavidus sp. MP-37]UDM51293.1 hypothetical protein LIN44_05735 [Cupriavidus sp. MP-37]
MTHVALDWHRIEWMPDETWKRVTLPKLEALGIRASDIERSVYVIRLNGDFCIQYPKGSSPAVYVGEGNFRSRITSHRKWVHELKDLVGNYGFEVCLAIPRVRNNGFAYQDAEAAILARFVEKYGSTPLWNKQRERLRRDYSYSRSQIDRAVGKRSGAKYKWALAPLRSSPFFRSYGKV